MKKQIGTKRYNTDTAKVVSVGKLRKVPAVLYIKRTGDFFFHVNPDTVFEDIHPTSTDKAFEFADKHGHREYFEESISFQSAVKKQTSFFLPDSTIEQINDIATNLKVSQSEAVNKMLLKGIEQYKMECFNTEAILDRLLEQLELSEKTSST